MSHSRRKGKSSIKNSGLAAIFLRSAAFLLLVGLCVAGARWISGRANSSPRWEAANSVHSSSSLAIAQLPSGIQARNRRLVYPYSVVPGGVRSAQELREVAAHDAAVAKHYSGFDYQHARVIEVKDPRMVYLSYRRGDRIYWTRKQASLHRGEKLLTDGSITARTRCGNQVSVLPRRDTGPEEPTMAELDRPDAVASGLETIPSSLSSSLLHVDPVMPFGHSPSAGISAGGPLGGFVPPPIGGGGGGGSPGGGHPGGGGCTSNCNPPPPPPPIPEPSTILLVLSGAAAIFARSRSGR